MMKNRMSKMMLKMKKDKKTKAMVGKPKREEDHKSHH
jgi:hypothetical protein